MRIKYFFLVRIPVLHAESVGSDIIYNIFKFLEILDIRCLSKWPPKYPKIGKKSPFWSYFEHLNDEKMLFEVRNQICMQ